MTGPAPSVPSTPAVGRRRRGWLRRTAVGVAVVVVGLAVVLGMEVQLARSRPTLPAREPFDVDGRVGASRPATPLDVMWLGDSTAAGVGATDVESTLPRLVAQGLERPVRVTSLAVSGARVGDVVDSQLDGVTDDDGDRGVAGGPDVVVISVGANDVTHLTGRDEFRAQYRQLVEGLPPGVEVVLLGVPDLGSAPRLDQPLRAIAGWRGRALSDDIENLAGDAGATFVDIAGETGPAFRREPDRYFAADGFHPSDAGYRAWADAVLAAIDESAMVPR